MTAQIALTVARKMFVRLLVSGIIIGLCILVMQLNLAIGILLMMLYSSLMVIKSSRKEMPLGKFTAILPGLMSLASFLFMLILIGVHNPLMPVIGLAAGIIPGWLMARGHRIYEKNGVVYAKRTFFYIFIWVLSLLFTQGSTLAGMREITDFGFLLNGFSTAMMVVLSSILIKKVSASFRMIRSKGISVSILLLLIPFLTFNLVSFPVDADGQNQNTLSLELRNRPRRPAGDSLMSDAERITNQENLQQYQQTFRNRNVARTAEQRARARQYSAGFRNADVDICPGHRAICYNPRTRGDSQYTNMVWDKNEDGICDICGGRYSYSSGRYKYVLKGNGYHTCNNITDHRLPDSLQPNPAPPLNPEPDFYPDRPLPDSPQPDPDVTPSPDPPVRPEPGSDPDIWNEIKKALRDFGFKDDDAAAAGVAVALMMLLGGMGMNAALTAAQETANAFMAAAQEDATDTSTESDDSNTESNPNTILDGAQAVQWMKDNGYYNADGIPTRKYHEFMNSPLSRKGPGLQGFAGNIDENGTPSGHFAIVVSSGEGPDASPPESNETDGPVSSESVQSIQEDKKEENEPDTSDKAEQNKTTSEPSSGSESRPKADDTNKSTETISPAGDPEQKADKPEASKTAAEKEQSSDTDDTEKQSKKGKPEENKEAPGFFSQLWNRGSQDVKDFAFAGYEMVKYTFTDGEFFFNALKGSAEDAEKIGNLFNGKAAAQAGAVLAEEISKDPQILSDTLAGSVETVKQLAEDAKNLAIDAGNNINKTVKETAEGAQEMIQFLSSDQTTDDKTGILAETLKESVKDIYRVDENEKVAAAIRKTLSDPDKVYDGVKSLTGIQDFEDSWDPDKSVYERVGHALLGTMNVGDAVGAAQVVKNAAKSGAKSVLNKVAGSAAGFVDDGAKTALSLADKAGDLSRATKTAATAIDNVGDLKQTVKAVDAAQDAATDTAAILNRADDVHDTARDADRVIDTADNLTSTGTRPAGSADDFGTIDIGDAPDYEDIAQSTTKSPTDYAETLENRSTKKGSTIPAGNRDDFISAENVTPDTSGYTLASQKHMAVTADKYGVQIHGRPTNSAASSLIERGEALPKPQLLKNKTINNIDTYIGFSPDDIGKVGHGEPVKPDWDNIPENIRSEVKNRYVQRAQEFVDQKKWLDAHKDQVRIQGNLIVDTKTGKPFTGDVDLFDIRGRHGETLPASVTEQITKELKEGMPGITEELAGRPHRGHSNVMHGRHNDWNWSGYDDKTAWDKHVAVTGDKHGVVITGNLPIDSATGKVVPGDIDSLVIQGADGKTPPAAVIKQIKKELKDGVQFSGEGQSKRAIAEAIDKKIRRSHTPGHEALVTYSPDLDPKPGRSPNPTATYWNGGEKNPFVD